MLPLSPVEIIEALLPGLIALTSILVVVIAFLLERYIPLKLQPEGETYHRLTWFMTAALVEGGIGSILSLFFLLEIGGENIPHLAFLLYAVILTLFILCILSVIVGTIMTVKSITKVT